MIAQCALWVQMLQFTCKQQQTSSQYFCTFPIGKTNQLCPSVAPSISCSHFNDMFINNNNKHPQPIKEHYSIFLPVFQTPSPQALHSGALTSIHMCKQFNLRVKNTKPITIHYNQGDTYQVLHTYIHRAVPCLT